MTNGKSNDRPMNQMIDVTFYKESGKWYAKGYAVVNHYLFDEEFKQDIVNTQTAMREGWQNNEYYVVTSAPKHVNGFFEALFQPGEFWGYVREGEKE
jgi:hypothetical protein